MARKQPQTAHGSLLRAACCATLALSARAGATVQFGQLDDFEDGTTMGWQEGGPSPNPPTNELGGPGGAGDHYMRDFSSGVGSAGSRQIFFNQIQWTGDFVSAHVTRMQAQMINLGATPLYMRVAVQGVAGSAASTNAIPLAPGSGWQPVTFDFANGGLTPIFGGSVSDILSNLFEIRILSSQFGNVVIGDTVESTVGADNIRAGTIPGDANFDNTVNGIDFNAIASNYGIANRAWGDGDFDFSQTVNSTDFTLLAQNFGKSISLTAPASLSALAPEPGITGLVIANAFSLSLYSGRGRGRGFFNRKLQVENRK